ncbi:MAG: diguanylate cyclase, partial [Ruminococcus sp.]|nr:diguanylate cyclase [Ruminococcus sp.]
RYDGSGYPDHLKGEEIPEIARIISVADAYDAMTSLRSYRAPIPQQKVREELVKCSGTQFDPKFAKIMLHLIDLDIEYKMIERGEKNKENSGSDLVIDSHRSGVSDGIHLSNKLSVTDIKVSPYDSAAGLPARPSMILFDSLDGQIHSSEIEKKDLEYFEYGEIWFDGTTVVSNARKMQTSVTDKGGGKAGEFRIEAARVKDHAMIRITGENQTNEVIVALPDSTRFAYISFTGEHCRITDIKTENTDTEITADMIPRIAEEISFINVPAGDIPNVQVDGYRTDASQGVLVEDGMEISFHAMSLPTARLVWHCPFLNLFGADDGRVFGENYRDYMLERLDGECWEGDPGCTVTSSNSISGDFVSWDEWKSRSKAGFDCTFTFERKDNIITVHTENGGVIVKAVAKITDGNETVYAAITGDQVALTNIRIKKPDKEQ